MAIKCPKCQTENPETARFCLDCGTQLSSSKEIHPEVTETLQAPVRELTTGSTFAGRYQIIEELGKGGMGRVYKVFDTDIKEKVALKLLKPEIASDKETIERFSNELKYARKIRHKNVCGMYDLGKAEGTHFITMEYVQGEDLKSMIRMAAGLSIGAVLSIGKQVCDGLAEAHSLGVVHRDLKPQNIMIDKSGNAKIMDFGIARSIREKGITGPSVLIGTPEYMSPEQAEAKEVDHRSDIYSLGIILYEMATGRVPFEGDTALSIAMKHKGEIPKNPKQFNPNIPDDLSGVILKCLEKDKAQRYQAAAEVRSELEKVEKGIPTTERVAPERKPFTSREITVQFSVKKLFIPTLIFVAVIVIGLILWKVLPRGKSAPSFPSDKPSLAVVYFMNQTGDKALDHWREALPRWITTDLYQSKYINVLPADGLFSVLKKLNLLDAEKYASEDLKNIAREGRVNHIFQASYSKAGDIFRIDYSLQRADTLEIISSYYVTGKSEESFPSLVDEITKKIKTDLRLSDKQMENDIDRNAGTITSSSPEAFKYYTIGRKYLLQGENRKSIELMEQAVAIDPTFAMAYRSMGRAYGNLLYYSKAKEFAQKALEFKDRLSDRERYLIEGDFYSQSEATYDKSIEAYEKLLGVYPDDTIARSNLAICYLNIEDFQKAIQHLEICIKKYRSNFIGSYTNLAESYKTLGSYDKAKEICEEYLNNFPDNAAIHRRLAFIYVDQGRYDLGLKEIDKAFSLEPTSWQNFLGKGHIYSSMGDWKKAEEEFRKLLEKEETVARSWGTLSLGLMFRLNGRFKDSIEMAKEGVRQGEKAGEEVWIMNRMMMLAEMDLVLFNPEEALKKLDIVWDSVVKDEDVSGRVRPLNIKALAYIEMKRTAEAQKAAEELKRIVEQGVNKNHIRLYYHLMGRIELEKNNYAGAIEFFKKGLPYVLPNSDEFLVYADSLGLAYYKIGDLEKASEEYEKIASFIMYNSYNGEIYPKSFYMLGKIRQQQGDTTKAIEHYEKFLSLWKDADPGLPEVEDARKRLAGLK